MTIAMGSYANPIDIAALKQTYENAGQGQVFTFWDKLSEDEQAKFAKQLSEIDVERVNRIYENAMAAVAVAPPPKPAGNEAPTLKTSDQPTTPTADAVSPLPPTSCASAINNAEEEARWRSTGLKAIADGKVAVLLLAGGQGTRLGSANPKGMFDISLPSGRTLFEIQAARIRRLREVVSEATGKPAEQVRIPWYVMTSGPTRTVTEAYFEKKNYFGLPREDVVFFEQGKFMDPDGANFAQVFSPLFPTRASSSSRPLPASRSLRTETEVFTPPSAAPSSRARPGLSCRT